MPVFRPLPKIAARTGCGSLSSTQFLGPWLPALRHTLFRISGHGQVACVPVRKGKCGMC
jgi:hypothetical protein